MEWVLVVMLETVLSPYYPGVVSMPMKTEQGCQEALQEMKKFWGGNFKKGHCIKSR